MDIGPAAEGDIRSIRERIAQDKPRAAARWTSEVKKQILSLAVLPERYELIPEALDVGPDYRHFLFGQYRILYRVESRRVVVIRVIHGARALTARMLHAEERSDE